MTHNDLTLKMKRCPFCAEEILLAAIKCRYCGSMLSAEAVIPSEEIISSRPGSARPTGVTILAAVAALGPLGAVFTLFTIANLQVIPPLLGMWISRDTHLLFTIGMGLMQGVIAWNLWKMTATGRTLTIWLIWFGLINGVLSAPKALMQMESMSQRYGSIVILSGVTVQIVMAVALLVVLRYLNKRRHLFH